jgi:predicted AlkP superfamily pyrophosphatase or phosphodiesterase
MRAFVAVALVLALLVPGAEPARADAYHAKPKLVVVLVIDQFRGDYLER